MDLEWESNYETGNEYVDLQHRYFVDLINRVGAFLADYLNKSAFRDIGIFSICL